MNIDKGLLERALRDAEDAGGWGDDPIIAWLRALTYLIFYYIQARGLL